MAQASGEECCKATKRIIQKTEGILSPSHLYNFLIHIKGKHKPLEIAEKFTEDIPALIKQLRNIRTTYLKESKKNEEVEKDLRNIDTLCDRLINKSDSPCILL